MPKTNKTLLAAELARIAPEMARDTPTNRETVYTKMLVELETMPPALVTISSRVLTQDSRCTEHPMFCVQIKVRDVGFDTAYSENKCWHDGANEETVYDDDKNFAGEPEGDEWDEFGYHDHWETVMVAFTEGGCKEYLELNGHNDKRRAHNGEVRIYVESFNRCPEMIAIRQALLAARK